MPPPVASRPQVLTCSGAPYAERHVRQARAAAAAAAEADVATSTRDFNEDHFNIPPVAGGGPTSAARTMTVGSGVSDSDDEMDAPPSYGQLHGRVLGTGEPPGALLISGVSNQDLEQE